MGLGEKKDHNDAEVYITMDQASAEVKKIVGQLQYPYRILRENLTSEQIMESYREAAERGRREGFTPVLIPEDEYFDISWYADRSSVTEMLKKADMDGRELLSGYLKEFTDLEEEGNDMEEMMGGLEGGETIDVFSSMDDYMDGGMRQTVLFEIPTRNPWEVVVYVPFGGWNDCPAPDEMAAICKYWYETYGAVPAVISHDTLEFILPQPIAKDEAMKVAQEHFAFCGDRVDQCTQSGTIGEVADCLWRSCVWYFWWD